MMYAPGFFERIEKRERRRRLLHRIVFDALGMVLLVLLLTSDWWQR